MDTTLLTTPGWDGYRLLDSGKGRRLERFGTYIIDKPDPEAIWMPQKPQETWNSATARYEKSGASDGGWIRTSGMPHSWHMRYRALTFEARLTPFKHTGIFPEQSVHWDWMMDRISKWPQPAKVLNLFAYTGISTLACASAGASVTHVDASKPSIGWAKRNLELSGLGNKPVRWILDDAVKFMSREVKRGMRYDAIIMDPPVYGHGPSGEVWDFQTGFPTLLSLANQLLSDKPLFVLVNAYAVSHSPISLANAVGDMIKRNDADISCGELALTHEDSTRILSTGIYVRWIRRT